tara:strand:+ start:2069 stop:2269 length:201 start_codon:yes stop_codon:yes gene_type:complete
MVRILGQHILLGHQIHGTEPDFATSGGEVWHSQSPRLAAQLQEQAIPEMAARLDVPSKSHRASATN